MLFLLIYGHLRQTLASLCATLRVQQTTFGKTIKTKQKKKKIVDFPLHNNRLGSAHHADVSWNCFVYVSLLISLQFLFWILGFQWKCFCLSWYNKRILMLRVFRMRGFLLWQMPLYLWMPLWLSCYSAQTTFTTDIDFFAALLCTQTHTHNTESKKLNKVLLQVATKTINNDDWLAASVLTDTV